MAAYRTYQTGSFSRPTFFRGFSFFPPVIKWLMISNVVVWFLTDFLLAPFVLEGVPVMSYLLRVLALWPLGPNFAPWELVTYMFLHDGLWHLFFNMLALWMFGMELENIWGSRKFLIYYFITGLGGGLAHLLVAPLLGQVNPTVGASGAVFGVLIAFGMLFPDRPIYLYFLIPIRARILIAIWIGLELFSGVVGSSNIAHFAHLGGALAGFLFVAIDTDRIPLRELFVRFRGEDKYPFVGSNRVRQPRSEVHDATFYDIRTGRPGPKRDEEEVTQEVIDAILDKISTGGYQSLSEEEKRILNEASKRMH